MSTDVTDEETWALMSYPVHDQAPVTAAPWRDNAFLACWDPRVNLFAVAHVSTSPNAGGRRARFSAVVDGRAEELIEPLEPGTFAGQYIEFDLITHTVRVSSPGLSATLVMTPRFACADYSSTNLIPALVEQAPLRHYQQGVDVRGEVTVHGMTVAVDGQGMRDRTWGPRDESAAFEEYLGVVGSLPGFDMTVMKFRGVGSEARTHGFLLFPERSVVVREMNLNRTAAGLIDGAVLITEDGDTMSIRMRSARGGFWVPMGDGGPPPTMSAYDDAVDMEVDGQLGAGFTEQGVLRRL